MFFRTALKSARKAKFLEIKILKVLLSRRPQIHPKKIEFFLIKNI